MRAAVVLFTRDLRVHDNPALAAAVEAAETVLPAVRARRRDRRHAVRRRRGPSRVSPRVARRSRRLAPRARRGARRAPRRRGGRDGAGRAGGGSHGGLRERRRQPVRRRARTATRGRARPAPRRRQLRRPCGRGDADGQRPLPGLLALPPRLVAGAVGLARADADGRSPPARRRAGPRCPPRGSRHRWEAARARASSEPAPGCATHLEGYGSGGHDAIAADATSRLSPYLHFGCVSPRSLAVRAQEQGGDAFVRQLCWRDFYAQILHAQPRTQVEDLRPRGDRWLDDPDGLAAWKEGLTGYPLVDAGMRQLRRGRLDAQPGPDGGRLVPRQGSRDRLARGRTALLRPAARRRRGAEHRQLAMGRRHGCRHAPEPRSTTRPRS